MPETIKFSYYHQLIDWLLVATIGDHGQLNDWFSKVLSSPPPTMNKSPQNMSETPNFLL